MKPHGSALPGAVRIIGGSLRGSKLSVAAIPGLRPTPQRLRETLFNWLMPVIEGARVLDLFAGSGALGIEALSRGAAHALLIERDRAQAAHIGADLERLRLATAEVRCTQALEFLASATAEAYHVVFVDPPFETDVWTAAAATLDARGWLAPGAYIYLESPVEPAFTLPAGWILHRESRAGAVRGALYRRP